MPMHGFCIDAEGEPASMACAHARGFFMKCGTVHPHEESSLAMDATVNVFQNYCLKS